MDTLLKTQFLLLTASQLTYCIGLEKEGAVTSAQISARHVSDYSPNGFHLAEHSGQIDLQEHETSPELPEDQSCFSHIDMVA